MHQHLTTWLVVLALLQRIQGDQQHVQKCYEYCLKCGNENSYIIPNVSIQDRLEVSFLLQNGGLPRAQIVFKGAEPKTTITVNRDNVTLRNGKVSTTLKLPPPRDAFWTTVVLDLTETNTLLVYSPENRINVLRTNTVHNSIVSISSNEVTHVMFNCLSGCIIRNSLPAHVRNASLKPPFTMYLKPTATRRFHTPTLALTPRQGRNVTVDASEWTVGVWHRVEFLVEGKNERQQEVFQQEGKDEANKIIQVSNITYSIAKLRGFQWTLHCAPEGFIDNIVPSATPDSQNITETSATTPSEIDQGTEGTDEDHGETAAEQGAKVGAGAGEVTAWVMAGLALFLVMVLALALCTKTARQSPPPHFHDSQPSVGMIYCKNAFREPEEDSEPESPNELKVPTFRNSASYQVKGRKLEDD